MCIATKQMVTAAEVAQSEIIDTMYHDMTEREF